MKAAELRGKSIVELRELMEKEMRTRFALRMQRAGGQLGAPSEIKKTRRNIARIITLMREKAVAYRGAGDE